jgi:rSAM/selenodomain-associated transferase 1
MILKAPRTGMVKTRLAREIGDERAAAVYRALAEHQAIAIPANWEVSVHFTPADAAEEMETWLGPYLPSLARFVPQCEGDLGQRLREAVDAEFQRGANRVFLIGGDCPGISHDYLAKADEELNNSDLVIGPATDGGYVLLGLKRQCVALFENIAWSTQAVFDQTMVAARHHSLSTRLLPVLEDIDDAASLARQARFLPISLRGGEKKSQTKST